MKYPLIAAKVFNEPWAINDETLSAIWRAVSEGVPLAQPRAHDRFDDAQEAREEADANDIPVTGFTRVIPVFGIIGKHLSEMEMDCGGCSADKVSALLTAADRDPDCERIVLAFHSPGGTVTGIPELAAKIRDVGTRKPVIAYTDGMCCSAALWLASQADTFLVSPSSMVGSVGVRCMVLDQSERLAKEGIKAESITSGKYKDMGANHRPMTDDERKMLQARVDSIGKAFRAALTASRTIASEDMEGQTFSGEEAVAKGFADGMANDLDEVLEIAGG
jgi:protease-4